MRNCHLAPSLLHFRRQLSVSSRSATFGIHGSLSAPHDISLFYLPNFGPTGLDGDPWRLNSDFVRPKADYLGVWGRSPQKDKELSGDLLATPEYFDYIFR